MVVQFSRDPDVAKETRKIDSLVVKDGKVIITRHVNKPKAGAVTPPAPRELPDNVLAPPDAGQPAASKAATDTAKSSPPEAPAKKP